MKANESRDRFSLANLRYKNWLSLMNSDSGAWLSAGLSPTLFVMSNNEFISAVCRRNAVEDPMVPKYTPLASRESVATFNVDAMEELSRSLLIPLVTTWSGARLELMRFAFTMKWCCCWRSYFEVYD